MLLISQNNSKNNNLSKGHNKGAYTHELQRNRRRRRRAETYPGPCLPACLVSSVSSLP